MFEKLASQDRPDPQNFVQPFDSLDARTDLVQVDLSQFLAEETNVFINDYGPGLLSSPSYRGGAAEQTILVWNGAKLNSPMLGTTDLSIIAIDQFQELSVFTSSSSNVYSSGGIGGGIWLGNDPDYAQTRITTDLSVGSYELYGQSADANLAFKLGKQPAAIRWSINHRNSANDFIYVDNSSEPFTEKRRAHSSYNNLNSQLSFSSFIGKKWEYSIIYWRNQAFREVPNTIKLRVPSEALQRDTADRFQALIHFRPGSKWQVDYMAFYEFNRNYYQDDRIDLQNLNSFRSFQHSFEIGYQASGRVQVNGIFNQQSLAATSGNYDGTAQQLQQSFLLNADIHAWKGGKIIPALKVLEVEGDVYVLPNASLEQAILPERKLSLRINYSENLRLPTLNELYWVPGGNSELQPEEGRTVEAGVVSFISGDRASLEARFNAFFGSFENWIRWRPEGATFRPQNVLDVRQRGFEGNARIRIRTGALSWQVNAGAVYSEVIDQGSELYMVYVPRFQGHISASMNWKQLSIRYSHSYMDERFITSDNLQYMPRYDLGNMLLSAGILDSEQWQIQLGGGVNNVWNTNYQVLAWRPMPKRNYFIQLRGQWTKA